MARSTVRAATVASGREPRPGANVPEGAVGRTPVRRTVSRGREPPNVRVAAHPRVKIPRAKANAAGPPKENAAARPRRVSVRAARVPKQRRLPTPRSATAPGAAPRPRGPADAGAPTVPAIPVNATAAMRPHPKGAAVPRATEAAGEEAVVAADGATPVRATTVPGGSVSSPRPG